MTFSSTILPLAKNFCQATQLQCEQLADFLLPRRYSVCMTELATAPALCLTCWMDLHFIQSPICARTGVPLPFDLGPESVSLSAMRFPPAYDRARSALIYNGTARQLIHKFKFHNRPEIADLLTPWLETCGQDLLKDADYLIPVPLHLFRIVSRRYNQSAELARALSKSSGVPMKVEWLRRVKKTSQQVGMTRDMRRKNLKGAFEVKPNKVHALEGKNVILIDDVITTGSTLTACAKTLRKAGVARIDVLSVARVVMHETVAV